jgi:N-acetylglucosaminyldiphosphoundecaprenol N-acetyl-beta-D-mannosaminyltransferase
MEANLGTVSSGEPLEISTVGLPNREENSAANRLLKMSLLGVGVNPTSYDEVLAQCRHWVETHQRTGEATPENQSHQRGRTVAFLDVHTVMNAVYHGDFRTTLNAIDICSPDGMPLVWALRSLGVSRQPRVYGPDAMLALCDQAARRGYRVYFYGGREDTLATLLAQLTRRYPALLIAGSYSPPFRELTQEERSRCCDRILSSKADLVFVGLGAPKQERWMAENADLLPGVVLFGVGAAFNFHSGAVRQAPPWMRRNGLEWLFRLCVEPRRLWKRYLLINPVFILLWAFQYARVLRYRERPGRKGGEDPASKNSRNASTASTVFKRDFQ